MTGLLVLIAFPFLWVTICLLLARVGGWQRLGERFRAVAPFDGPTTSFVSANMKGSFEVSYGSCLTVGANAHGLHLAVFPLFQVGHPPLLLPWREVRVGERKRMWFTEMVTLHLGGADDVTLQLYAKTADQLLAARSSAA